MKTNKRNYNLIRNTIYQQSFFNISVIFLIVDSWKSCVCFIRSGVTRCTLLMVLYLDRMCRRGLHAVLWSHIGTLMHRLSAEPCSTAYFYSLLGVPLERSCYTRIRWCGTDGFKDQGQCFFIGLSCSIPTIVFYSFSISLLSVYRLLLWGWGLQTDRVHTTLFQPCTADLFKYIYIYTHTHLDTR